MAGFHRSGTSLTAQILDRSGVFLGYDMLPKHRSNPHGHFEDREIVRFHDEILADNGLTWQVDGSSLPVVEEDHRRRMRKIAEKRNDEREVWGFKDPRVCLFMDTWKDILPDARVLIVYRSFAESTHSLHRRAANGLLYGTGRPRFHNKFWKEPDLALKMWLVHNKSLIDFAHTYPEDVLVVSFDMLRQGFPLIQALNQYWGLALEETTGLEAFDPNVTSKPIGKQAVSEESLIGDTLDTWKSLEQLGKRTEDLTGIPVKVDGEVTEEAFYVPKDAYKLVMEKQFMGFELDHARRRLKEAEADDSQGLTGENSPQAKSEQKSPKTQPRKAEGNVLSPRRKSELQAAEKDLKLIIRRISGSKFAPVFRLKKEFRELEKKYLP